MNVALPPTAVCSTTVAVVLPIGVTLQLNLLAVLDVGRHHELGLVGRTGGADPVAAVGDRHAVQSRRASR